MTTRALEQQDFREIEVRFEQLYSALVYDILDQMGLPNQCLDLAIKPLQRDMVIVGPAFTIAGGPDPRPKEEWPRDPRLDNYALFDAIKPRHVIVVAAAGELHCGHWGELMSNAAKARGAVGVVIDGGIRDGRLLSKIEDWPVFARYTSPIESKSRYRVWDIQCPIAMSGSLTSQVRVNPGDWVFGDMDGVIVIPAAAVGEVLGRAEEAKVVEDRVRQEIRRGVSVAEVYERYGRL
jgi:4-hydroxy-4-methyl-2-oxoglutarate aldolase